MEPWVIIFIVVGSILLLVLALVIFLSATQSNKKVWDYKWLFEVPIAHRGYHLNNEVVPENSSVAFQRAIDRKYNIEIDLNLTKDNKVVVFHDGTLNRMCDVDKKVHDLTLAELQELKLKGGQYHMMELQEFLDLVNGQVGVLIEYKMEGKEINRILCEESWKILSNYKGNWVMQSFQPGILAWFKKNHPEVPRGQLCHNYMKDVPSTDKTPAYQRWMFTNMLTNFVGRPNFVSRDWKAMNFMVKALHITGTKLLTWTVNTDEAYNKVKGKVDNIIFEYFDLDLNGNIK